MNISRREFIAGAGVGLLTINSRIFAQSTPSVIVLGAGLSGLSAAIQLAGKGFGVTMVEARDRVGGRIFSFREPFRDGQYVELGGETVGDGYGRFLAYADGLGVKYEVVPPEAPAGVASGDLQKRISGSAIIGGKLYPAGSVLDTNPYKLPAAEAAELPTTQLYRHIGAIGAEVRANPGKLAEFDSISLAAALRKRGVSDAMIRLMDIALNYNSIETVSMGGILWESRRRSTAGTKAIHVVGGNDQVPLAMAKAAKDVGVVISNGLRATRIAYTDNSVKVTVIDKRGHKTEIKADRLVCTIPFSVLRSVEFSPALPESKRKAIDGLDYTRITKIYIQAERAGWDDKNLGSSVWTDTPCERIFNAAGKKGDKNGIFTIWTDGEGAKLPESKTDKKRLEWGKREIVRALPFFNDKVVATGTKSWTNDEFALGAYSHFKVGQLTAIQPHIKTDVGPIHFAGEHTAEFAPGIEGALESADRASREIMRS